MITILKKQIEEIKNYIKTRLEDYVSVELKEISNKIGKLKYDDFRHENLEQIIESQQATIEQLSLALSEKTKNGTLIVFNPKMDKPKVYRNGTETGSGSNVTNIEYRWSYDGMDSLEVSYR